MSESDSKLAHFPVALFTSLMGLIGLTLAWRKAEIVFAFPAVVSTLLLVGEILLLGLLSWFYFSKWRVHADQVRAELMHPIKISFFSAYSIALMLIAVALADWTTGLATLFWLAGIALHLTLTLFLMNQWIHHQRWQIAHTTPAWFIPIVGNIIAPLAGVRLGFEELSWFFFSIGVLYWLVLKVLVFNRIIFHEPLPEKLLPTLFIMIAPPAVGFLAYVELIGSIDAFARVLYYSACFVVLLLISQLKMFAKLTFSLSWWAYTFPLAAFCVATLQMYQQTDSGFLLIMSIALLLKITAVVSLVGYKTVLAWRSERLFVPD